MIRRARWVVGLDRSRSLAVPGGPLPSTLMENRDSRESSEEGSSDLIDLELAWLLSRSTVTSVLLGASKLEQLENNLGSLNTHLGPDQIKRLDDLSSVEMGFPHAILANPTIKQTISGGVEVHRKVALRLKVSGDPEYLRA